MDYSFSIFKSKKIFSTFLFPQTAVIDHVCDGEESKWSTRVS